jgi:DNA-directed RNA polymerase subunit RPC12/RpoP
MPFEMICSRCKARLLVADDMTGREVRCALCGARLRVPEPRRGRRRDSGRGPEEPRPQAVRRGREFDDSEETERRPRPRRRPPAGRSPLVILAIIFGVLFVGCVGCCGGAYFLLPGEEWRRHQSADGGFAVDLPAPVKKDLPIPGFKPEPGQKVEGAVLWKRAEFYVVMYADVPPPGQRAVSDDDALEFAVKEVRTDPECRLVRAGRVTVSGFPAREVEFVADGGTYLGRFVLADRRIYVVIAGGRFVRPDSANVRRFLDSFAVTGAGEQAGRKNAE